VLSLRHHGAEIGCVGSGFLDSSSYGVDSFYELSLA